MFWLPRCCWGCFSIITAARRCLMRTAGPIHTQEACRYCYIAPREPSPRLADKGRAAVLQQIQDLETRTARLRESASLTASAVFSSQRSHPYLRGLHSSGPIMPTQPMAHVSGGRHVAGGTADVPGDAARKPFRCVSLFPYPVQLLSILVHSPPRPCVPKTNESLHAK